MTPLVLDLLKPTKDAFAICSALVFRIILSVHIVESQIVCKAGYDKPSMLHLFPFPEEPRLSPLIHYFRIYFASIINMLLMLFLDLLV